MSPPPNTLRDYINYLAEQQSKQPEAALTQPSRVRCAAIIEQAIAAIDAKLLDDDALFQGPRPRH